MVVTLISIISMRFLLLSCFFFLTSDSGSCNGVTHFTEVETSQYQMSPVWTFYNHVQNFTGISWFEAEIALKELEMFLEANNIDSNRLNKKQRIILVASEFDAQTLSAVAWLNTNNVDISCYQICLNRTEDKIFIDMKKLLPVDDYNDYFVNISKKTNNTFRKQRNGAITRRQLPKIDTMLEWGIVKPNDKIIAKNTNEECILLESGLIRTKDNEEMSLQQWLKNITGWSSVETYVFSIHAATGKSLSELRAEYMENNEDK